MTTRSERVATRVLSRRFTGTFSIDIQVDFQAISEWGLRFAILKHGERMRPKWLTFENVRLNLRRRSLADFPEADQHADLSSGPASNGRREIQ